MNADGNQKEDLKSNTPRTDAAMHDKMRDGGEVSRPRLSAAALNTCGTTGTGTE